METIQHVFQQRQHMLLEDYEIYHYKDSRELHVSLHFHDFYECYLLLSGGIRYQIESASFSIQPGDLLLIGPNQLHRPLFTQTDEPSERLVLWLSRSFVERLSTPETDLAACFSAQRLSANRLSAEQREAITRQFFALLNATNSEQFGRDVLCSSLVTSLLVTLNRADAAQTVHDLLADEPRRAAIAAHAKACVAERYTARHVLERILELVVPS